MDTFENEFFDDELAIEITDLPGDEDEQTALSGNVGGPGTRPLTGSRHISRMFVRGVERVAHVSSRARTWLWNEASGADLAESRQLEDMELDLSDVPDLPSARLSWTTHKLPGSVRRFSPRKRARHMLLTCFTLLMVLLFFSTLFPNIGVGLTALFAPPPPAPAQVSSSEIVLPANSDSGALIIEASPVTPGIGVTPVYSSAGPGQMPQMSSCAQYPSPVSGGEIGQSPVWLSGFAGPNAHLHLHNASVFSPNFPSTFSWAVHLKLELAVGFTEPVIITGRAQQDGQYLLFAFDPNFDMGQKLSLTLDPEDPMTPPSSNPASRLQKISWDLTIYIPGADCYDINLAWPDGGERIDFVAGW